MSFPIPPRSEAELVSRTPSTTGKIGGAERKAALHQPFREVLGRLGQEVDRGERLVERAITAAPSSDPGQLIALQAGIYRYTEAVELSSKLVDRTGAAVRTVLQNQG